MLASHLAWSNHCNGAGEERNPSLATPTSHSTSLLLAIFLYVSGIN